MVLVFPIRTDRRLHRWPWVNAGLIAANVLVYLLTLDHLDSLQVRRLFLYPLTPQLGQFFSYQFLHHDAWHLLANMIFLWVFGNNVEDRLGRVSYLAFYLAGGVLAGLAECLTVIPPLPGQAPPAVLGASGAVAAVTCAFLVLFPRTHVTLVYWVVILFGGFEIASVLLVGFQVAQNVVMHLWGSGGVAYVAHLAGYLYGFVAVLLLLRLRLLPREPQDLLSQLEHWQRRQKFRQLAAGGYNPWEREDDAPAASPLAPLPSAATSAGPTLPDTGSAIASGPEPRFAAMRGQITRHVQEHRLAEAAELYAQLLAIGGGQVLARQHQLDLANQLAAEGRRELAARAYELYLQAYPTDPQADDVALMLALLYARYLDRRQRARELLRPLRPKLTDPRHRTLVEALWQELPDDGA